MKTRFLSILMTLALAVSLLPGAALAAEGHWAQSAVDTLNKIYGTTVFSTEETAMTVEDARAALNAMGSPTDALAGESSFTRALACEALADAFALQPEETAIDFLYEKNIINGESVGNLNPTGSVSKAEFAVLTYRVLNYTGGGLGSTSALKPGTDAYFAWMYLAVRRSVPFTSHQTGSSIGSVTDFNTYKLAADTEYTDGAIVTSVEIGPQSGEGIWNAWAAALSEPKIGGVADFKDKLTECYQADEPMKDAAVRMMEAYIDAYALAKGTTPTIFTDVTPDDWWYDGVMYSFDAGYVNGLGNGSFGPEYRLPLYELASLLYRINPNVSTDGIDLPFLKNWDNATYEGRIMLNNKNLQDAMKAAVAAGYLSWKDGNTEDFDPTDTVSRQEAIADILKACAQGKNVNLNLSSVNTAVLDRFTDIGQLTPEQEQYLAYAVSHGMVNGTSPTTLNPNGDITRAEAGVLLYRTLLGLDETKIKDYTDNVNHALEGGA